MVLIDSCNCVQILYGKTIIILRKRLAPNLKSETSNIRVRDRVSNTFMGHHILNRYSYQINPQTKY
jgi:hypothetical protein